MSPCPIGPPEEVHTIGNASRSAILRPKLSWPINARRRASLLPNAQRTCRLSVTDLDAFSQRKYVREDDIRTPEPEPPRAHSELAKRQLDLLQWGVLQRCRSTVRPIAVAHRAKRTTVSRPLPAMGRSVLKCRVLRSLKIRRISAHRTCPNGPDRPEVHQLKNAGPGKRIGSPGPAFCPQWTGSIIDRRSNPSALRSAGG
jgi:hypothetical protein